MRFTNTVSACGLGFLLVTLVGMTVSTNTLAFFIVGGPGNDTVTVPGGSIDLIDVKGGDDTINWSGGTLAAAGGLIDGGTGNDNINWTGGSILAGAAGIKGNDGNDTLTITSAAAFTTIPGGVSLDGGNDTDTLVFQGASGTVDFSKFLSWENMNIDAGSTISVINSATANAISIANTAILNIGIGSTTGSITANVTNSGVLTFNRSDALTYASVISGGGSVTKLGGGTLTLSGANTYSGGTTVSGGVLQGTTASLQGNITNTANVTFDQTTTGTYAGVISGTGSLTKSNTGTVILSGANTYSGGTTVSGGVLQGTTTSLQGNITNTANVTFDQTTTGTYAGVISGTGSLTKSNTGTVILSGANTYSGGTTVSGGVLQGTTASLQGNITNTANVTFDQTTTGTYAGVISGTGSLTKSNTGTVILSGANTYSGGTTVSGGVLQGTTTSLQGNITNTANVTFDQTTTGTYASVISGTGSLTKSNTGTVILSGANTYSGTTNINAGTLFINGSNANSTTTVNAGGTLGGTGTVGSVLINGGTFAPGNSIGTTNVAGNVDFSGGGTYQVEVNAAGQSDRINATGSATLTNGKIQVMPETGTYNFTTDYTILNAAGGVNGTFASSSIDSNFAFLTPTLSYDANNVYLNLKRNSVSFTNVATTPNQIAVSRVLTQLGITNPTDVKTIMDQLLLLTNGGAQQAFDSLSGMQHSPGGALSNNQMHRFLQLLKVYRGSHGWGNNLTSLDPSNNAAYTMSGMNSGDIFINKDIHWWIQGMAGDGDIDRDGTIGGVSYHHSGLAFGADMALNDHWTLGLAGSFVNSNVNGNNSDADVDSYQLAAYANWRKDDWYVDTAVGIATHDTDADRTVIVGTLTGIAESDYDSDTIGASIEVGKRFQLNNELNLTPFAGIEYAKTDREDFSETGSFANLLIDDEDYESIRSKLGLRLSKTLKTDRGTEYIPSMSIAYVHEHGNKDNFIKAAFTTAPNNTFIIEGNDMDRDRLQLNFGITGKVGDNTSFNLGYQGEYAGSDDYHSLNATLRVSWH